MALSDAQIASKVKSLLARSAERDGRASKVTSVRQGDIASIFPDFFPEGIDANVVSNFIDIVARDLSEVMAPLPTVNCASVSATTDKARHFADTRTSIASNYFIHSDLSVGMYSLADNYITYGFGVFIVEPDTESGLPRIRIESSRLAYPEYDKYGRTVSFAKVYQSTIGDLVAQFPEFEQQLRGSRDNRKEDDSTVEMVRYWDKDVIAMYVPSRDNLFLSRVKNPIKKMTVVCPRRPSIDGEMRGQFDDVIGIQMLRNRFAFMAMEAAEKAIQAPIVVPNDVQNFVMGGDSLIRTANPQGVHRVDLHLPQGAFSEQQMLDQEMRTGTRYPDGRSGQVNASVITGQGVQALMGAFDTQVKASQAIFAVALRDVIAICFEMDEKLFNKEKTIRGVDAGAPYEVKYLPKKDIAGDYTAEVRYGMLAGLNPAQGLVFMLQALSGGLIAKDSAMRELPFNVNVSKEQEKIEIENMRDSLLKGIEALSQAIPAMVTQGQDPSTIISNMATVIKQRQAGETLESSILTAFAPAPAPVAPAGSPAAPQSSPAGQEAPAGAPTPDLGSGAPPPGQPTDIQSILTNLGATGKMGGSVRTVHTTK